MSTTLILIRHGETSYNRDRRYQGYRDTSLTRKGKRQTRETALRLRNEPLDAIYSSDLKRTRYMAEIINSYHSLKINILPELREIDFGDWEGKTYNEIQREWKGLLSGWEKEPSKIKIPNGESIQELAKRTRTIIKKIISAHSNQKVAIITHGGPIRIILMDALGLGADNWWKTITSNGGISIIEYQSKRAEVLFQNDTSHLKNF
ncbi:MAG TPA: alpha-ribazole phosphatase [bacterium]|nr:alpha-ribazole phosphatase [bacterium]